MSSKREPFCLNPSYTRADEGEGIITVQLMLDLKVDLSDVRASGVMEPLGPREKIYKV